MQTVFYENLDENRTVKGKITRFLPNVLKHLEIIGVPEDDAEFAARFFWKGAQQALNCLLNDEPFFIPDKDKYTFAEKNFFNGITEVTRLLKIEPI